MRHINGVYTQRHNRLKQTDGPLFRGRYKAICVEADSYQLQLSRYIHRNPLETKRVRELDSYEWSSYKYYVRSTAKPPEWLYRSDVYGQLGVKSRRKDKYRAKNLFDKNAREPSPAGISTASIPDDLPLAGRSFFGEIRYRF